MPRVVREDVVVEALPWATCNRLAEEPERPERQSRTAAKTNTNERRPGAPRCVPRDTAATLLEPSSQWQRAIFFVVTKWASFDFFLKKKDLEVATGWFPVVGYTTKQIQNTI